MNKNYFFLPGDASDSFYTAVRGRQNRLLEKAYDLIEAMWQKYAPYAEPDFQHAANKDLYAKLGEMYLGLQKRTSENAHGFGK